MSQAKAQGDHLHALSILLLGHPDAHGAAYEYCCNLKAEAGQEFNALAEAHHVVVRASLALAGFAKLHSLPTPSWISTPSQAENNATRKSLITLEDVCSELERNGFPPVIIKSLDHWPDLGNDLDIYTTGSESAICRLIKERFNATIQPQSWSDRLARKWNFRIRGLTRLIEIHIGCLGQVGEQTRLGRALLQRRTPKTVRNLSFMVPSPADQIILAVLNRFYRHYCLRICDIANTVHLLQTSAIDLEQLKRDAKLAGIKPGLSTYLSVIDQYYRHYCGQSLGLPAHILRSASFGVDKVYAHGGFLRIPLFPQGTKLFTRELGKAIRRKDLKKSARLSLVPPLAAVASVKFRITGKDKGIW